ncbi:MAG: ChaB family protein [Frankiaceae bacterium]
MPATGKSGKPKKSDIPSTVARSDDKAQRTWAKTHDSAVDAYGEGERAHRTAFSSLKHTHEKVGDHWEPKRGGRKGPSDAQAAGGRGTSRRTHGGVDANAPKTELYDIAKRLDVPGRSRMSKGELVSAIEKANAKETRAARQR